MKPFKTVGNYNARLGLVGAPMIIPDATSLTLDGKRFCTDKSVYHLPLGMGKVPICLLDNDGDGHFDRWELFQSNGSFGLKQRLPYRRNATRTVGVPTGFRQEFLFMGAGGGVLRISYREFKDGLARPAFTEELSYDAPKRFPSDISLKGFTISVHDLNNSGLSYRLKGMPEAQRSSN
jgi:hypothetical protein